jgi:ABC-type nickel/cobalt efflux system permease component RcnA
MRPVRVDAGVLRNREGTAVDPVPFLVVSGLSLVGSLSFVPVYCLTLGLSMPVSVGAGVAVFLGLSTVAYHRMVWTHRPELRGEVPAAVRLQRLVYGVLVVAGVLLFLTLLLLSR